MDQWANRAHTGARATAARYSCPPQKNNCVPLLLIHSLLSRTSIYLSLTLFLSLTRLYCPLLLVLLLLLLLLLWLSVVGPARVSTLFINCFAPNLYYFDRLRFGLKLKSNSRTVCMVLLVSWQWQFVVYMPKKKHCIRKLTFGWPREIMDMDCWCLEMAHIVTDGYMYLSIATAGISWILPNSYD